MAHDNLESRYYEFLRERGYIQDDFNAGVNEEYISFFQSGQHVLDIGCGDGSFMKLLQEEGCTVTGLDIDPDMVKIARERGLEVVEGDVLEYLSNTPQGTYDAVFSSNVIEHLPPETVVEMVKLSYNVLKPGGLLLLATPNPESIIVHLYEFWRDATHVRPYNRQLVEFILWEAGFEQIKSDVNRQSAWEPDIEMESVFFNIPDLDVSLEPSATTPADTPVSPSTPSATEAVTNDAATAATTDDETAPMSEQAPDIAPDVPAIPTRLNTQVAESLTNITPSVEDAPVYPEWMMRRLRPAVDSVVQSRLSVVADHLQMLIRSVKQIETGMGRMVDRIDHVDSRVDESIQYTNNISQQLSGYIQELSGHVFELGERTNRMNERLDELAVYSEQIDTQVNTLLTEIQSLMAQVNEIVQYLATAFNQISQVQYKNQKQLDSLKASQRMLFPPREIYITGRKPQ